MKSVSYGQFVVVFLTSFIFFLSLFFLLPKRNTGCNILRINRMQYASSSVVIKFFPHQFENRVYRLRKIIKKIVFYFFHLKLKSMCDEIVISMLFVRIAKKLFGKWWKCCSLKLFLDFIRYAQYSWMAPQQSRVCPPFSFIIYMK